jgi:hypothetical protein
MVDRVMTLVLVVKKLDYLIEYKNMVDRVMTLVLVVKKLDYLIVLWNCFLYYLLCHDIAEILIKLV